MKNLFMERLDAARAYAGIPFVVTSGFRCQKHNKIVGGTPTSSHLSGCAVDIKCVKSSSRYRIIAALIRAGFHRIGIRKDFIHVDEDKSKYSDVLWIY